jgi:2-polyprenyl-3-methyl-5-hydroxy-6-metoxy-1,4-benzoquinol methylase
MKASSFLIVPSVAKGQGTGHLARAIALEKALVARGLSAGIYLPPGKETRYGPDEIERLFHLKPMRAVDEAGLLPGSFDCLVLDRFRTSRAEYESFSAIAPCVGIDEGGAARTYLDYLIDTLPRDTDANPPNLGRAFQFLDLPERKREFPTDIGSVLVSFGGEGSRPLAASAIQALAPLAASRSLRVTLLCADSDIAQRAQALGFTAQARIPGLKERLFEYDLVITHFGLTAFEALASGSAVLLLDPTPYHGRLARAAGIPSLGSRAGQAELERLIREPRHLKAGSEPLRAELRALEQNNARGPEALAQTLESLDFSRVSREERFCRACQPSRPEAPALPSPALWRDGERSYFECPRCLTAGMKRFSPNPIHYSKDYFFADYQRQYGKTYLEDFGHLRELASSRVQRIEKTLGSLRGKRVLDIGCAYGAFLAEAKARGALCYGIEAAPEAAAYAQDQVGAQTAAGYFPDVDPRKAFGVDAFDVVSLWYVIEHFEGVGDCLKAISSLVSPGGVLALSTPSLSGAMGRFRAQDFFTQSPADHFSVFSPSSLKKLLPLYGFGQVSAVSTGHHPERLPLWGQARALRPALLTASRAFHWGDTFESYAVKRA